MNQGGRDQGVERGSDEDAVASTSDIPRPSVTQQPLHPSASSDLKKRTKTVCSTSMCTSFQLIIHVTSNEHATRVEAAKSDATSLLMR